MEQDRVREVPLTYDDYRIMPDEERYELIEGELLVTPAPSPKHQQISLRILMALVDHVQRVHTGQELTTARMYQRGMALVGALLEGFELKLDCVFQ